MGVWYNRKQVTDAAALETPGPKGLASLVQKQGRPRTVRPGALRQALRRASTMPGNDRATVGARRGGFVFSPIAHKLATT